jgi:hypothetical protein
MKLLRLKEIGWVAVFEVVVFTTGLLVVALDVFIWRA